MQRNRVVRWIAAMVLVVVASASAHAQASLPAEDQGYLTSDKNWIAGLRVVRRETGFYANFDVHYTGRPEGAKVLLRQANLLPMYRNRPEFKPPSADAVKGLKHVVLPLGPPESGAEKVTLAVDLVTSQGVLATRTITTPIKWPTDAEFQAMSAANGPPLRPAPPGADKNLIANAAAKRKADGTWEVSFNYFYTGEPAGAMLRMTRKDGGAGANSPSERSSGQTPPAQRGWHWHMFTLERPNSDKLNVTVEALLELVGPDYRALAKEPLPTRIEWPSHHVMAVQRELANMSAEEIVEKAALLVDEATNQSMENAKEFLERAIELDPRTDAAYIEMARVAMKTNWGPEGLQQAERLLDTALKIRDSTNGRILLAYVYAYQKRFPQAEALLADAAKRNPPNLWLWTNWGELEELQGHGEQAIAHYRQTLARPAPGNTYDRARDFSYGKLFTLLESRKDFDGLEQLHQQRVEEYGGLGCDGVNYARFMIERRGDAAAAIVLARRAMQGSCDRTTVRDTLGMAHYLAWAQGSEPQRAESLNQARVYLPVSAKVFYLLAIGDRTAAAAKLLAQSGEKVDMQDNGNWNALAYALQARDAGAAARLVTLGARPEALVGPDKFPVAFLPVFLKDEAGIRVMQRAGVDYTKLRHAGATAIELARSAGENEVLRMLERPGT